MTSRNMPLVQLDALNIFQFLHLPHKTYSIQLYDQVTCL